MPRKKSKVESALRKKGFEQTSGDHRFFVYVTLEGRRTTVRTKTSHTPKMKEIPDNILAQMSKQCRLKKSDFLQLVDCPLTREEYERRLRDRGIF